MHQNLPSPGAAREAPAALILFKILDGTPKKMFKILGEPLTPKSKKKCKFLVVKEATLKALTPDTHPYTHTPQSERGYPLNPYP